MHEEGIMSEEMPEKLARTVIDGEPETAAQLAILNGPLPRDCQS